MHDTTTVTRILERAAGGDRLATAELLPLVYDELRELALKYLGRERASHTLQPTALVHEAYLRMAGSDRQWAGRSHFLAVAAIAMRNVLVDAARRRSADKRGADAGRVSLENCDAGFASRDLQVLELDDLIKRLSEMDARRGRVVELKFFAAMSNEQIAEALDVSRSTVADDWTIAKAWLTAQLSRE